MSGKYSYGTNYCAICHRITDQMYDAFADRWVSCCGCERTQRFVSSMEHEGYENVVKLKSGLYCGTLRGICNGQLVVGLNPDGWVRRFDYATYEEAVVALQMWELLGGEGDPPGDWIKEKPSDRLGPGAAGYGLMRNR